MGLTYIQAATIAGSSTTSISGAYGSPTTSQSWLVAFVWVNTQSTIFAITDTLGNTWTQVGSNIVDTTKHPEIGIFQCKINKVGGGANTITATSTASGYMRTEMAEYTGQILSGDPVDVSAGNFWYYTNGSIGPITGGFSDETLVTLSYLQTGSDVTSPDGTIRLN